MPIKVLSVVGARPQFVKAAPVSRCIASTPGIEEIMVHTGQHFDPEMSDHFFDELDIPEPRHHLGVHGGNHGDMTGRMLAALEGVMVRERPACVVVYGDTNSTLAGALAAAKLGIPIAHVEAGLRSFNRNMPEEINRILTDRVSTLLFCPTETAVTNLAQEGVKEGVHQVGDVMYDVAVYARAKARSSSRVLERLDLAGGDFAVATVHRAENTESRSALGAIFDYLNGVAQSEPVVLPLHPRTREAAERFGVDFGSLTVYPPVSYLDMAQLLDGCTAVYTDSGGLQKEAYFYNKPCVTLRAETEWVETIECGWNRLWTVSEYRPRREIREYGDGRAAERIVTLIADSV